MIQRDFILRLIEQLGAMARAFVSGQMTSAAQSESHALLESAAEQGLGLKYSTLLKTPPEELLHLFQSGGATFQSRTALAGCILASAARMAEANDETAQADAIGTKALYLLEQLRGNPALEEDYRISEHVGDLVKLLRHCRGRLLAARMILRWGS